MPRKSPDPLTVKTEIDPADKRLQQLLVTFEMPDDPTSEEVDLAAEIVRVDHQSLHTLPPKSSERGEIRDLLINVVVLFHGRQPKASRALLQRAEAVYFQHIQARNRLRYLIGMLVGILTMIAFGMMILRVSGVLEGVLPTKILPFVLLFAGMGAMTSVLTRLSSIDLRDQTSLPMVFISGMARPIAAVFFSLVVSLVLALRIFEIHVGTADPDTVQPALFLISAFLCGFSERFAQDVLAKVGGEVGSGHGVGSTGISQHVPTRIGGHADKAQNTEKRNSRD
jgi:hypothetical protein